MINMDSNVILEAARIVEGNHPDLAKKLRDIESRRTAATTFVVGIHKMRKRDHHEYKMSDGSIAIMDDRAALISTAAGVKCLAMKDQEIADLKAKIAELSKK